MSLNQQLLNSIFGYCDGELYWKIKRYGGGGKINIGDKAGSLMKIGYYCINSSLIYQPPRPELVHRIIWVMHHGAIPDDKTIDHIDSNRLNNKIENLRCVSHQDNMRNVRLHKDNKSGTCGVRKAPRPEGSWTARIVDKNKKELHLGTFKSKQEAINARKVAEVRLGYHANHGLPRT